MGRLLRKSAVAAGVKRKGSKEKEKRKRKGKKKKGKKGRRGRRTHRVFRQSTRKKKKKKKSVYSTIPPSPKGGGRKGWGGVVWGGVGWLDEWKSRYWIGAPEKTGLDWSFFFFFFFFSCCSVTSSLTQLLGRLSSVHVKEDTTETERYMVHTFITEGTPSGGGRRR